MYVFVNLADNLRLSPQAPFFPFLPGGTDVQRPRIFSRAAIFLASFIFLTVASVIMSCDWFCTGSPCDLDYEVEKYRVQEASDPSPA